MSKEKIRSIKELGKCRGGIKPITAFIICTALIMLYASCSNSYRAEEEVPDNGGGIHLASDEFVEGLANTEGEVTTRFYTNDPKYWGLNGTTLWTVWGLEAPTDAFVEREVMMSKAKGDVSAGYGLVICQGERQVEGAAEKTMLVVMINNKGEYTIGKVIGGLYEVIEWWTANAALNAGAGVPNRIKVRKESGAYVVYAGSIEITRFVDDEEPIHNGGRNGYVVVISSLDRLPTDEVDVLFTEKK